ncbi:MAG: alpha/beta hydrolase [Hyphomicrobiaceae bacterium]
MTRIVVALMLIAFVLSPAHARDEITLKTTDGLTYTADVYRARTEPDAPWIVLAHQAGASRGEYREIAPRLNALGFNAVALDQRSGGGFAGGANTAFARARKLKKKRTYLAARPDIEAGIAWARRQTSGTVILWGSSYSAALAILMAGEKADLVDGVVSNSPGEYLRGKSVSGAAKAITVPVLITSPARERKRWRKIFKNIPHDRKEGFAPKSGGVHGSSAFIAGRNISAEAYWSVAEAFLAQFVK